VDSSRLEHLLKVIECGSITKASEELGYTQSGISHMVKALEKEFGFPLFARGRSGVEPTEDCKRIIPAIRQIVRWNEQLGQLTADIRGLTVGTVRVGTFTSVSVHWLPKILKRFQTQHPQVKIDLVEGGDQSLAHGLENGLVDVAFGRRPETLAADWVPLFPDQLMAVLPLGAWSGQSFPIAQFHKAPFIALPEHFDQEVQQIFRDKNIEPEIRFSSTDDYTIVSLVEQGLGYSILPQLVLQGYRHCGIQALPLDPPQPRQLGMAVLSLENASPAVKKFMACVQEMILSETLR